MDVGPRRLLTGTSPSYDQMVSTTLTDLSSRKSVKLCSEIGDRGASRWVCIVDVDTVVRRWLLGGIGGGTGRRSPSGGSSCCATSGDLPPTPESGRIMEDSGSSGTLYRLFPVAFASRLSGWFGTAGSAKVAGLGSRQIEETSSARDKVGGYTDGEEGTRERWRRSGDGRYALGGWVTDERPAVGKPLA